MKSLSISLILLFFYSGNLLAANCTPEINGKNVLIEFINQKGKTIYSQNHKIRTKEKYAGLISSTKALKAIVTNTSKNVKVKSPKLSLSPAGTITEVSTKDGSTLTLIGGCPIPRVKFFTRAGKQKKPFVHADVIKLASKSVITEDAEAVESRSNTEISSISESSARAEKKKKRKKEPSVEPVATTKAVTRATAKNISKTKTAIEAKTRSRREQDNGANTSDVNNSDAAQPDPSTLTNTQAAGLQLREMLNFVASRSFGMSVDSWLLLVKFNLGELDQFDNLNAALHAVYGEEWSSVAKNEFEAKRKMPRFKKRLLKDAAKLNKTRNIFFLSGLGKYDFDESAYNLQSMGPLYTFAPRFNLDKKHPPSFTVPMAANKAELVKNKIILKNQSLELVVGQYQVKIVKVEKLFPEAAFLPSNYEFEAKVKKLDFYATLGNKGTQEKPKPHGEEWLFSVN